jgi:hypothetical protein
MRQQKCANVREQQAGETVDSGRAAGEGRGRDALLSALGWQLAAISRQQEPRGDRRRSAVQPSGGRQPCSENVPSIPGYPPPRKPRCVSHRRKRTVTEVL